MSQISSPTPTGPSPIQDILLVEKFERRRTGFRFAATSLPGHLLHFTVSGEVKQECNGREYVLRPGSVIWYHEDESVRGKVLGAPWVFYSVNFIAPALPPPPFEQRLYAGLKTLHPHFQELLRVCREPRQPSMERSFLAHAALLRILAALARPMQKPYGVDPRARLWWELETECRRDLKRPLNMAWMTQHAHASPATIARSCKYALGMPPLKRIKQVRLSLARGLVLRSRLSMKEIAERTGYPRIHEFSRDYRKYYGKPPTADRRGGSW
jgi:AraC-like DNA-binding protein